ncbi:MAG: efflux RND transporter permease subunit [Myxococcota bacterium]|nr:efflux RND transporter permease subunit [Myxococcota bacterium]
MGENLESDLDQNTLNPRFAALAQWVLSHRLITIILAAGLAVVAVLVITTEGLEFDNRPEVFSNRNSEAIVALQEVRETFGRDDLFVVLIEGDVFSKPFLRKLKSLEEDIGKIDIGFSGGDSSFWESEEDPWVGEEGGTLIRGTTSLFTVRETRPTEDGIVVGTPLDAWPDIGDLSDVRQRILMNHQYVGHLVDITGRYTTIIVQTEIFESEKTTKVHHKLKEAVSRYRGDGFKIWLTGVPSLGTTLNELNISDTTRLTTLAVVMILFFLICIFRNVIGVMGPIIVIVYAMLMSLGFVAAMGYTLNGLSSVLPAFLVIVCVGDSVHLQSVYRDLRKKGVHNHQAIVSAVGITGLPMLFTTLTTAVGLFSFRLASLDAICELGTAAAFGIFGAFFVTILVLPVMLSWNKTSLLGARDSQRGFDFLDGLLVFCNRLSGTLRRPFGGGACFRRDANRRLKVTLVMGSLVVAASSYSAQFIKVSHDPLSWLSDDLEVKAGFQTIDTNLGGTAPILLMVTPKSKRGLRNLDFIKRLEVLEERILSYKHEGWTKPLVTNSSGILDIIRETNQALHGGDVSFYKIPDTERALSDILFLFENVGPDQLRQIATADLSKTKMQFSLHWLPATEYQPLADAIAEDIAELFVPGEVRTTGVVYSLLSTIGALVRDLVRSFGLAFLVITVMLVFLFRDLKMGLVAMVPNLVPIVMLLSVMVMADMPLDMSTLMVFSIAIGICVDDTIHFLHHFKAHYENDTDTEAAITEALKHGGRAIVITSIVLIAGMGSQVFAQLISIARFGVLVSTTIGLALVADLILAPAVLRLFYPSKKRESGSLG